MSTTEIYRELETIFRDVFDDESIRVHPELSAADLEEWDSFMHINLLVASEQRFGIKFNAVEIDRLRNVGDFAELIRAKLG